MASNLRRFGYATTPWRRWRRSAVDPVPAAGCPKWRSVKVDSPDLVLEMKLKFSTGMNNGCFGSWSSWSLEISGVESSLDLPTLGGVEKVYLKIRMQLGTSTGRSVEQIIGIVSVVTNTSISSHGISNPKMLSRCVSGNQRNVHQYDQVWSFQPRGMKDMLNSTTSPKGSRNIPKPPGKVHFTIFTSGDIGDTRQRSGSYAACQRGMYSTHIMLGWTCCYPNIHTSEAHDF